MAAAADSPKIDRRAGISQGLRDRRLHSLDEVDFGRKVARDFETNFLLANFGLRPGLHGVSSKR
jgi:hypothetical protein